VLGKRGINIARFSLGREGRQALAIVEVDNTVSPEALAELRKVPSVQSVASVMV